MELTYLGIVLAVAGVTLLIHSVFFILKLVLASKDPGYEHINNAELGKASHSHHGGCLSGSVSLSSSMASLTTSHIVARTNHDL
jgi:hypothetical protein